MAVNLDRILPNMTDTEISFSLWLTLQKDCQRREHTIRLHLRNLRRLKHDNITLSPPTNFDDFIAKLTIAGISTSYRNNFIGTARLFSRFCKEKGRLYDKSLLKYKDFKDVYREKAIMSPEEVEAFLALPRVKNASDYNHNAWTLYFALIAYTGMRTGEVAALEVHEVDFGLGIFNLPAQKVKTNRSRQIPIPDILVDRLKEHISSLTTSFLFKSKRPEGHVSNVEWHYQFHTRINRLGIKRANLTPYSLRHSYATHMADQDRVNVFDLKNLMGHSDIRMTEHYYHRSLTRLKNTAAKHPAFIRNANFIKIIFDFAMTMGLEKLTGYGYSFSEDELRIYKKD